MFAIDTNLLIYAHNRASPFYQEATKFLEQIMNNRDEDGRLNICLPAQVLIEFVHVITWERLEHPLTLSQARGLVQDYLDMHIAIIYQRDTQLQTFLELLRSATSRKNIFDIALAATLKDNDITGLYTHNVTDFEQFDFLQVINPIPE